MLFKADEYDSLIVSPSISELFLTRYFLLIFIYGFFNKLLSIL